MTAPAAAPPGLTTTKAPFIEAAQARGELYIEQPYEQYSDANHDTWRRLYARMTPRWERFANPRFLEGLATLSLDPNRVPRLDDVNRFMSPRTGFRAKPVSGYVPAFRFFDCLRNREFPTTITIRDGEVLDYLPEPDIFHDIGGHVPMHCDQAFADTLVSFGECAHTAAEFVRGISDRHEQLRTLTSIQQAMARFFWFTIEFGLMDGPAPHECRVYGSGLLSSYGEIEHAVTSPMVQRMPLQLEWVINQSFEIDQYQPLLFVVRDFEHLFGEVRRLEEWMKQGKLSNVAPGEPAISEADLASFLETGH
jgi:phenylalanine-4-hydroxylase